MIRCAIIRCAIVWCAMVRCAMVWAQVCRWESALAVCPVLAPWHRGIIAPTSTVGQGGTHHSSLHHGAPHHSTLHHSAPEERSRAPHGAPWHVSARSGGLCHGAEQCTSWCGGLCHGVGASRGHSAFCTPVSHCNLPPVHSPHCSEQLHYSGHFVDCRDSSNSSLVVIWCSSKSMSCIDFFFT